MMGFRTLLISLSLLFSGVLVAQETIPLWEGFDVNRGKGVTLKAYVAEHNESGIAVIVCPGGSYYWLDDVNEGDDVAQWLQSNGITAFVLRYRTAGLPAFLFHYRRLFNGRRHPVMVSDAQRALQWVREHAGQYHIDPNKLGMMGFSAGGHLVMSAACFSETDFLKDYGIDTKVSLQPSFLVPVYPVVTMRKPYVHKRSRCALLSEKLQHDPVMIDSLSLERHIPADCPPVFLVNCVDDPIVDYHNSMLLDSALTANHVNHRYFLYQTGGHSFGASDVKGTEESRQWKNEFLNWLHNLEF